MFCEINIKYLTIVSAKFSFGMAINSHKRIATKALRRYGSFKSPESFSSYV